MSTGVLEGQRLQISLELDLQFVSCPMWNRTHIFGRVRMHPQSLRHLFIPLFIFNGIKESHSADELPFCTWWLYHKYDTGR